MYSVYCAQYCLEIHIFMQIIGIFYHEFKSYNVYEIMLNFGAGHDAFTVHLHYGPGARHQEQYVHQTDRRNTAAALLPGAHPHRRSIQPADHVWVKSRSALVLQNACVDSK